ncbi:TetR/AcrR family transcriptional regulator [Paenibacillus sp. JX-17]|uniref:TetR/AcrR family transcriptional regulator n=1 Tax=Paenibacillus lacisoli TaxID=3064525 RepID=A0ABT9CE59_9BACL|nr:TetR/AcrR family transcriptional regulator [Paenibacillus sp. JX-17]MDO7907501.1 TetR/AcrR family transcriptional regulator [Paenibacillus sp. JX-17]
MIKMDRRAQRSQTAIKKAFIELMAERNFDQMTIQDISDRANVGRRTVYDHYMDKFDILNKLIEEHIHELKILCRDADDLSFAEGNLIWFEYFEKHDSFFSTILASKGASVFRSRFLEFVMEELEGEVKEEGINHGLSKDLIVKFFGAAIVEIVIAWINQGLSEPSEIVAEQVGILLDRNF